MTTNASAALRLENHAASRSIRLFSPYKLQATLQRLLVSAVLLLLTGCMDSTHFIKDQSGSIPARASYYIAQPDDGMYGAKTYVGSGKMTSAIIKAALQKNSQTVVSARRVESFDQALDSARLSGCSYLVFPIILHWEDRATEWNFLRDKVQVKIDLVDVFTGEAESSTLIEGKSGIATLGGDHPQDLLPEPINEYFQSVFSTPRL
ncbi:MAG: DUF4823 domain-containing protein [Pseudomonas sp.]|uniref:DUF4823 domain-containing protein n=1 Tax=Pseudomonas sp. TaxID=306 RepID=UPI003D0F89F1